jgi:acetyltransferase-like isoleucine patch superfamily enzyme
MRKIVIRKPSPIEPFNEPARALRVLNKPLWQWQQDLLAPYVEDQIMVDDPRNAPRDPVETIVHSENVWFDESFLDFFIKEARLKRRPARAAFQTDDPCYLQHGLRNISRSYTPRADLYYVDLWYFPSGLSDQAEAVVVPSDAAKVPFRHPPIMTPNQPPHTESDWYLPQRAVCAIDSWVHLLYANIVFGVFSQAQRAGASSGGIQAALLSIVERKPTYSTSALVQVGKDCHIDPSAVIRGPCLIGDNVTIGPGVFVSRSVIGSNVVLTGSNHFDLCVLSDDCFFPFGASASMTVFMEGSSAGHGTSMELSVVGRNTVIGSGTVFTDFNILPVPLKAMGDHHLIEIGLPMLGACIGHNCRIGSGLVFFPGRTVESDVVLVASATRRVIAKNITYEESDHHYIRDGSLHPRRYPRMEEDPEVAEQGQPQNI